MDTKKLAERFLRRVYNKYRSNAKRKGRVFLLSLEEFRKIIAKDCEYCGDEPVLRKRKDKGSKYLRLNGVDRVDSGLGYRIDNCVPACSVCNYAKGTLSREDFLLKVKEVYEFQKLEDYIGERENMESLGKEESEG